MESMDNDHSSLMHAVITPVMNTKLDKSSMFDGSEAGVQLNHYLV